jgi:hypothetical protein
LTARADDDVKALREALRALPGAGSAQRQLRSRRVRRAWPSGRRDEAPMEPFVRAGDHVIDLVGGGPDRLLAAARRGAGRVWGFEATEARAQRTRDAIAAEHLVGVISVLSRARFEGVARQMAGRIDVVLLEASALPDETLARVDRALGPGGRVLLRVESAEAQARFTNFLAAHRLQPAMNSDAFADGWIVFERAPG